MRNTILLFVLLALLSCKEDEPDIVESLVGANGDPRFNLAFTNPENVDLDLYVIDPHGDRIYYGQTFSASGGQLDVDCLCSECPQGPNENIYWPTDGTAPSGDYEYWVEFYGSCSDGIEDSPSSEYTLRVVVNKKIIKTHTGTISRGLSEKWVFTKD